VKKKNEIKRAKLARMEEILIKMITMSLSISYWTRISIGSVPPIGAASRSV
jgi:hypothetical protein